MAQSADAFLDAQSADDFLDGKVAASPGLFTRAINKAEGLAHDIWTGIGGGAAGYRAPTPDTSPEAIARAREAQEYGGYSPEATAAGSEAAVHAGTALGGGLVGTAAGAALALGSGAAAQGDPRTAQRAQDIISGALTYQPRNPNAAPAARSADVALGLPGLATQRVVADPLKSVFPGSAAKIDYLSQFAPLLIDPALKGVRATIRRVGAAPVQPWDTATGAPPETTSGTGMQSPQSMGAAAVNRGATEADPYRQPEKNGEFSPEDQQARRESLLRGGITGPVRQSAIEGNANDAGLQAGLTRFDALPEGRAAGEHFEQNETAPMRAHAQNIISDLGASAGTDPEMLYNRGGIIDQGPASLRNWIKAQVTGLYAEARSVGGTTPTSTLGRVRELLNGQSPEAQDFQGRVGSTADGEKLLGTMRDKLERDDAKTGGNYNSNTAEDFRKYFNSDGVYSPDRAWAIRQLQHATDDDTFEAADALIFQRGRQMHALSKTLLDDDPDLARIFEVDAKGNRTTPLEKVPDALLKLPKDSIDRFVELMQGAPDVLQPDAQAALNEARGHLVNKVLDVGARDGQVQRTFWNADGVNKVLRQNGLARSSLFADAENADNALTDLQNNGNILKVDPIYRGAAAQTHSITDFLERHAEMTGAGVGGSLGGVIGGPVGAGIGSSLGAAGARRIIAPFAERMREAKGNARWAEGMEDIGNYGPHQPGPSAGHGVATPPPSDRAGSIIPTLPPRTTPRTAPPGGPGMPPPGPAPGGPAPPPRGGNGATPPSAPATGINGAGAPPGAAPASAAPTPATPRSRTPSSAVQARTTQLAQELGVPEEAIDGRVRSLATKIRLEQRQREQAHTDDERAYHDVIIDNFRKELGAVLSRNVTASAYPKGGNGAPPSPVPPAVAASRTMAPNFVDRSEPMSSEDWHNLVMDRMAHGAPEAELQDLRRSRDAAVNREAQARFEAREWDSLRQQAPTVPPEVRASAAAASPAHEAALGRVSSLQTEILDALANPGLGEKGAAPLRENMRALTEHLRQSGVNAADIDAAIKAAKPSGRALMETPDADPEETARQQAAMDAMRADLLKDEEQTKRLRPPKPGTQYKTAKPFVLPPPRKK